MLSRTGRSCALMCDRTPDNARQEMLHARPRRDSLQVCPRRLRLQLGQRRRAPAQWRLGHDASPLPARPAPDIRAVKRSPRSTRACDPRAPPRWHGCLQVSACKGKKKNPVCFVEFCGKYFLPQATKGEWWGAHVARALTSSWRFESRAAGRMHHTVAMRSLSSAS